MPAETHSHRAPVDRREIERIVREQLAEILEVDPDAITADARLRDDLDADDYALIELVEAVEGELGERMVGLAIDDEDLAEWQTVADAIECVAASLDAEAEASRDRTPPPTPALPDAGAAAPARRRPSRPARGVARCPLQRPLAAARPRSRTARGARSTRRRRPTSASSSSAIRCSGWW